MSQEPSPKKKRGRPGHVSIREGPPAVAIYTWSSLERILAHTIPAFFASALSAFFVLPELIDILRFGLHSDIRGTLVFCGTLCLITALLWLSVVQRYLRTTTFEVNSDHLAIRHSHCFPPSKLAIPREEIVQIAVVTEKHSRWSERPGATSGYHLMSLSTDKKTFLVRTETYDEALFLEQWLEEQLGIEDIIVPGETPYKGPDALETTSPRFF